MKEQIKARIAELETNRTEFIVVAEREVAAYNARIDELQRLVALVDVQPDPGGGAEAG